MKESESVLFNLCVETVEITINQSMIYGEYPLKIYIVKTFDALPVSQVYAKWRYIENT